MTRRGRGEVAEEAARGRAILYRPALAAELGCSTKTLMRHVKKGKIPQPSYDFRNRAFWFKKELEEAGIQPEYCPFCGENLWLKGLRE